jgi:hypothetical protein
MFFQRMLIIVFCPGNEQPVQRALLSEGSTCPAEHIEQQVATIMPEERFADHLFWLPSDHIFLLFSDCAASPYFLSVFPLKVDPIFLQAADYFPAPFSDHVFLPDADHYFLPERGS